MNTFIVRDMSLTCVNITQTLAVCSQNANAQTKHLQVDDSTMQWFINSTMRKQTTNKTAWKEQTSMTNVSQHEEP